MKLSRAPLALYFDVLGGPDFEMDSADLVYSSNITLLLLLLVVVVSAADTCVERPMNFKSPATTAFAISPHGTYEQAMYSNYC